MRHEGTGSGQGVAVAVATVATVAITTAVVSGDSPGHSGGDNGEEDELQIESNNVTRSKLKEENIDTYKNLHLDSRLVRNELMLSAVSHGLL